MTRARLAARCISPLSWWGHNAAVEMYPRYLLGALLLCLLCQIGAVEVTAQTVSVVPINQDTPLLTLKGPYTSTQTLDQSFTLPDSSKTLTVSLSVTLGNSVSGYQGLVMFDAG